MIRIISFVLLGVATLFVVVRIVFHDDAPPEVPALSTSERSGFTAAATRRPMRAEPHSAALAGARVSGGVAPIVVHTTNGYVPNAVDIGPPQPVDEAPWWDTTTEAVELGEVLDADDPGAWASGVSAPMPREIGIPLDADSPWHDQVADHRRANESAATADTMPFDHGPLHSGSNDARRE